MLGVITRHTEFGNDFCVGVGGYLEGTESEFHYLCETVKAGADFIISTAPIQSSLSNDQPGMSGFCYKDLITSKEGQYIDYINCQAYDSYTLESLDNIVKNGYRSDKIVMGMLSGQSYQVELKKMVEKYKDMFGGVFIWEYFNAVPSALEWLTNIKTIYGDDTSSII